MHAGRGQKVHSLLLCCTTTQHRQYAAQLANAPPCHKTVPATEGSVSRQHGCLWEHPVVCGAIPRLLCAAAAAATCLLACRQAGTGKPAARSAAVTKRSCSPCMSGCAAQGLLVGHAAEC